MESSLLPKLAGGNSNERPIVHDRNTTKDSNLDRKRSSSCNPPSRQITERSITSSHRMARSGSLVPLSSSQPLPPTHKILKSPRSTPSKKSDKFKGRRKSTDKSILRTKSMNNRKSSKDKLNVLRTRALSPLGTIAVQRKSAPNSPQHSLSEYDAERAVARKRIAERRKKTMADIQRTEQKTLEERQKYKKRESQRLKEAQLKLRKRELIYYENALRKRLYEYQFEAYMKELKSKSQNESGGSTFENRV